VALRECTQAEDIVDFELNVCDTQPATLGGLKDEFIFSGRLDNLCMSYTGLMVRALSSYPTLPTRIG